MSHWRIDNPCFGHALSQSFTRRFPLPIYTTCSCHRSKPAESLASHFLCCSMCLIEFGERCAQQLFKCKSRTHTRRLCHLLMLYNMMQCANWQYYSAAGRWERLNRLQTSLWNSGGLVCWNGQMLLPWVYTCKVAQLNCIILLLPRPVLQASLLLLQLWSDLQPRGGIHHYSVFTHHRH